MTWPPCGLADCPVAPPTGDRLRRVRTTVLDARTALWRGTRRDPETLASPGAGRSRFAPLPGVHHAYVGRSRTVALLESALHSVSGPDPTIYLDLLAGWSVAEVESTAPLRLVDLRDPELARLGLARDELVTTSARHYPCTQAWAERLQDRKVGGQQVAGIVWHSRQADLHAAAQPEGLFADVVVHTPAEVAVLWQPHAPTRPLRATGRAEPLVVDGGPSRLVVELSALLQTPIF